MDFKVVSINYENVLFVDFNCSLFKDKERRSNCYKISQNNFDFVDQWAKIKSEKMVSLGVMVATLQEAERTMFF